MWYDAVLSKIIQFMRHLHFCRMNSDRNYNFIRRMTNSAKKEKRRRRNSFCKPAKSIAMGLSRVFIGFYTSGSNECIRMFWMQICKHELFVCLGWQSLDIIRHADTRTRGHALNIISEIKLSISLVLISFAINAIGFVSCLPIINESTTHPFPPLSPSLLSLSVRWPHPSAAHLANPHACGSRAD